jgi:copper resistance protein B
MFRQIPVSMLLSAVLALSSVRAQESPAADPHAGHEMMPTTAMPSNQEHAMGAGSGGMPGAQRDEVMDMGSMQGGSAPPDARDPHAYSDGYDFGPYPLRLADTHSFGSLLVDNLETVRSDGDSSTAYDLEAWYGRLYDHAVLKGEGDIDSGEIAEARSELLWGHAIATFWDTQLGVRYDSGDGPNRGWLAFGVQGLAPYWFDVEATGYLGEAGRTALRLNVSYELLLTQKLILQPRIEGNVYGKSDTGRGLGSGLSDLTAALRLRYEIRREFAPYLGVEWAGKFGDTQDLVRAAGEDANEMRFIAGLRFWF